MEREGKLPQMACRLLRLTSRIACPRRTINYVHREPELVQSTLLETELAQGDLA